MNRRNQPEGTVVCLFERGFAGERLPSPDLDETAPLGIALFDQIAFHYKILSHAISTLQEKTGL
jgi:hypothetical protein